MFRAPIPGQSLTTPPKEARYERPPEVTDPEEAIQVHLMRLMDEDRMNEILDILEFTPMTIMEVTQGIMRSAVANGIHSIDISLIAAPIVHEFIKQTADGVGIEYNEGLEDMEAKKRKERMRVAGMAKKKLKQMDVQPDPDFEREAEEPASQEPQGLVPRRGVME